MKVLKTLMFVVFATLIVGALTGCGGGGGGGDMTGGGGGDSGGGYDTDEFRKIQFWTYEECGNKKVLIESKDLARELDQGYFDNWGEPWYGGVWDSPFPGTTSDLLPAGNYNMCYERRCSGEWKHRYFGLNVDRGWSGQVPATIEVGDPAYWQSDNPGGCPTGIGGVGGGGGGDGGSGDGGDGDHGGGTATLNVINEHEDCSINEVYISLSSSDSWGSNVLTSGVVASGETASFTIGSCNNNIDLKAIMYCMTPAITIKSMNNYLECGKTYTWKPNPW